MICEFCGKEYYVNIELGGWNKNNIQELGRGKVNSRRFCCYECGIKSKLEKTKKTNLQKYGTENVFANEEIKKKLRMTNLQKYGHEVAFKSEVNQSKFKKAMMDKYGVENPYEVPQIREKMIATNMQKYGGPSPFSDKKIQEKAKKTNLKKYGVEYALQAPEVRDKVKSTMQKKYGHASFLEIDGFYSKHQEQIKKTMVDRYGVEYYIMHENILNSPLSKYSKINQRFAEKLDKNNIEYKKEFVLGNFCYDFLIEDILIEINPSYTHNSTNGFKGREDKVIDKNYHLKKSQNAKENGYRCVHVWDWDDEEKIINALKPKTKLYARKLQIKTVSKEETKEFLQNYHFQGSCNAQTIRLGLFDGDSLIQIMTFGKARYNNAYDWELLRLCTHPSFVVVGGANRLFKYFINENKPKSVISYCDDSKFVGKTYVDLGFVKIHSGVPSKHWYNIKTKRHITDNLLRQRGYSQLHMDKMHKKGESNTKLMIEAGYVEIYDSGQSTYVYVK